MSESTPEPAISIVGVTKRFGTLEAVKALTLEVPKGQCLGLVGPNGAGKSTTFSMMAGFVLPTEGQVRVFGKDPVHARSTKGHLGVLPQDSALPNSEVGAFLTYLAKLSGLPQPAESARDALARVGLEDSWKSRADRLSHGMAKRVALAQAILGDPQVVLFDEPTAGLDPQSAAAVRSLVAERRGARTQVISSHNLAELESLCDAVAILDHGKLVRHGSMDTLTRTHDELRVQLGVGTSALPLPELRALPHVTEVKLEGTDTLLVRYSSAELNPEAAVSSVLGLLLKSAVPVLGVSRGSRLEHAVLEATVPVPQK